MATIFPASNQLKRYLLYPRRHSRYTYIDRVSVSRGVVKRPYGRPSSVGVGFRIQFNLTEANSRVKMPDFCAAYGCSNSRCVETRARGITFHRFPKTRDRRREWELALRRANFSANDRSMLCSEHFKSEDFDRTGQTVRLKDGVVPSVFNFPAHLKRSVGRRATTTSRRTKGSETTCLMAEMPQFDGDPRAAGQRALSHKWQAIDHLYALPACPKAIKAKLDQASARIRKLQREKNNALKREKRAKNNIPVS